MEPVTKQVKFSPFREKMIELLDSDKTDREIQEEVFNAIVSEVFHYDPPLLSEVFHYDPPVLPVKH